MYEGVEIASILGVIKTLVSYSQLPLWQSIIVNRSKVSILLFPLGRDSLYFIRGESTTIFMVLIMVNSLSISSVRLRRRKHSRAMSSFELV